MKVSLIDTLGARHLRFWEPYLAALGVEVVRPRLPLSEAYELGRQSLPAEPAWVQLALGRILELGRSDLLLLPELPALAGDPWSEAFAEVLARRVGSLPTLVSVPTSGEALPAVATELGQRLIHNPGRVRLALERVKPLMSPPRPESPRWSVSGQRTVGVVGPHTLSQDSYLSGPLRAALEGAGLHPVWGHQLPEESVQERARRAGARSPGEAELAGAAGLLASKGSVAGLVFAVPARDAAVRRVAERLARDAFRPALVLEAAPELDADLSAFAERLMARASARPAGESA